MDKFNKLIKQYDFCIEKEDEFLEAEEVFDDMISKYILSFDEKVEKVSYNGSTVHFSYKLENIEDVTINKLKELYRKLYNEFYEAFEIPVGLTIHNGKIFHTIYDINKLEDVFNNYILEYKKIQTRNSEVE